MKKFLKTSLAFCSTSLLSASIALAAPLDAAQLATVSTPITDGLADFTKLGLILLATSGGMYAIFLLFRAFRAK